MLKIIYPVIIKCKGVKIKHVNLFITIIVSSIIGRKNRGIFKLKGILETFDYFLLILNCFLTLKNIGRIKETSINAKKF